MSTFVRGRVSTDTTRCDHDLKACRPCGTAAPGSNRFWPKLPARRKGDPRPVFRPAPNRADRRSAGFTAAHKHVLDRGHGWPR